MKGETKGAILKIKSAVLDKDKIRVFFCVRLFVVVLSEHLDCKRKNNRQEVLCFIHHDKK